MYEVQTKTNDKTEAGPLRQIALTFSIFLLSSTVQIAS